MDNFYLILLKAHSGWRWIVLLLVAATTIKMLVGWLAGQKWQALDYKLLLTSRISVYIQVILGLIIYILRMGWLDMRLTGEHVIMALLAVGGLEFGAARAKKSSADGKMFRFAFIGFIIALILIYVALQRVGGLFG
jgi:hypothetical protein